MLGNDGGHIRNESSFSKDTSLLNYGNYKLENDRFLSDYNIGNESTLRIKGRLLSCHVDDVPKIHHSR